MTSPEVFKTSGEKWQTSPEIIYIEKERKKEREIRKVMWICGKVFSGGRKME